MWQMLQRPGIVLGQMLLSIVVENESVVTIVAHFFMWVKVLAHYINLLTIEINDIVYNSKNTFFLCSVTFSLFKYVTNKHVIIKVYPVKNDRE